MIPIILSGGSGTRLWPLSSNEKPKQYLPLCGERTMIQDTVDRLAGIDGIERIVVVTGEKNRFITAEQLRNSSGQNGTSTLPVSIILEPCPKNTGPAIAAAAFYAQNVSAEEDPVVLVLPSDHIIADISAFHTAIAQAHTAALEGHIVTFGIVPLTPETGYGYIKAGKEASKNSYIIEEFAEKPDLLTAERYIKDGNYYWNSGMFMFKPSVFLGELKQYEPRIYESARESVKNAAHDTDFIRLDSSSFSKSPSNSIDYAVMEQTEKGVIVKLDAQWNDVGSWSALWDISRKDTNGNAVYTAAPDTGNIALINTRNSYIRSAAGKTIAAVGLENIIIVDTPDALLICAKEHSQDVKKAVEALKERKTLK